LITRNISPVPIRNAFADQTKAGGPLVHGEGGNTMSRAWTQWFQEVQNPSLSAADNLTAHPGGGQALATPVTTSVARFRTVGSAGDSALLPASAPGLQITVINSGAKSLNVFPQGTDGINGAAVFAVPSQSQQIFTCSNQGDWFTGAVAGGGGGGGGTGTVTSVGLAAPVEFTVSGSPVTSSGTLTLTKASEAANTVWAGPAADSAGVPGFRALVPNDIPSGVTLISSNYMVTGADNGMLLVANVSGALTITLPNPPPLASFDVSIENPTPGSLSISPNGLLLDGSAGSLTVTKNQGLYIATDGVNYYSERGMGTGGGGGGGSTIPTVHDESLTDGLGNFIFAAGDIVTVVGVPN